MQRSLLFSTVLCTPFLMAQSPRLTMAEGGATVMDATYHASFSAGGFRFSPLPGPGTAASPALAFQLCAVQRRNGAADAIEPVVPVIAGTQVRYPHHGVLERYDVRVDGVEQSFVLDRIPAGSGDLVVRGRLVTNLEASHVGSPVEELDFGRQGSVGIHIGAVTGIDALGRRTRGSLRCLPGELELILPADFVDSAAMPLVIDPLIGSTLQVSQLGFETGSPDAAYDSNHQVYAIVWRQRVSDTLWYPYYSIVRSDGTVLVPPQQLAGFQVGGTRVRIANVNSRDSFVIVWDGLSGTTPTLFCRTLHAASYTLSPTLTVTSQTSLMFPDVGGEAHSVPDAALAIYCNLTLGRVYARQIRVAANGMPFLGNLVTAGTAANPITEAAMPQAGGDVGRYLVTWSEGTRAATGVYGAVIDRDTFLRAPRFAIAPSAALGASDPFVDGDGMHWLVAYKDLNATAPTTSLDCRKVQLDLLSSTPVVDAPVTIRQSNSTLSAAGVAKLDESFLVGFVSEGQISHSCGLISLDPHTCMLCEAVYTVEAVSYGQPDFMVVGQHLPSTSRFTANALAVWSSANLTFGPRTVKARRFHPEDGVVTSLAGGCGNGGRAGSTCFVLGNSNYHLRLFEASPRAPAIAVLGATRLDFACGSCLLVPDPASGIVLVVGTTNALGEASLRLSIPPDPILLGASLFNQWATVRQNGACQTFGVDLSDALRTTLQ